MNDTLTKFITIQEVNGWFNPIGTSGLPPPSPPMQKQVGTPEHIKLTHLTPLQTTN